MSHLSHKQKEDCKECFTMYDKHNNGRIPNEELGTVVRSLGLRPTQADLSEAIRSCGIKGSAFSYDDLCRVCVKLNKPATEAEDEIRDAFRTFDRDGNGCISAVELKHVLTHMGEELNDADVDELMREINVTNDGMVRYDDVVQLMCSKTF